jgi:hypothetical protein
MPSLRDRIRTLPARRLQIPEIPRALDQVVAWLDLVFVPGENPWRADKRWSG